MQGKRNRTGKCQCSGRNGIEYGVYCEPRIGKRCIQHTVTGLHRHGQDDRVRVGKTRRQISCRDAVRRRTALQCKGVHRMARCAEQFSQIDLSHITADNGDGR